MEEFNDTVADYPKDKTIHQLFEEQARRARERAAVVFEEQRLTYAELNARANRLAGRLQGWGVGTESLVALFAERSADMVVGMAGAWVLPLAGMFFIMMIFLP